MTKKGNTITMKEIITALSELLKQSEANMIEITLMIGTLILIFKSADILNAVTNYKKAKSAKFKDTKDSEDKQKL